MLGMEKGDVLGHEPMGIVVEVGGSVTKLKKGDRVVGAVCYCLRSLFLLFKAALFMLRLDESRRRKSKQANGTRAGGQANTCAFLMPI